jgi:Tfp pilus assembly protein PilO
VSEKFLNSLSTVSPRVLLLAMVLLGAAAAFEGWVLVLRKPVAEYRGLVETKANLAAAIEIAEARSGELGRLTAELKQIADRLNGELGEPAPDEQLAVSLMNDLDRAAARSGIVLTSVKPGTRRSVLSFEEVSFEVGAQGKYLMLCEWLLGLERTLGKLATVTEFTMRSSDEGRQVALSLKVAVYRPAPIGGATK